MTPFWRLFGANMERKGGGEMCHNCPTKQTLLCRTAQHTVNHSAPGGHFKDNSLHLQKMVIVMSLYGHPVPTFFPTCAILSHFEPCWAIWTTFGSFLDLLGTTIGIFCVPKGVIVISPDGDHLVPTFVPTCSSHSGL